MDKYIKFSDDYFITLKKNREVQIKIYDNNGKPLISILYNVLFSPDLCDQLNSIITLMNLGYTCLFHKGVCIFLSDNKQNVVILLHIAQLKHVFLVKNVPPTASQALIHSRLTSRARQT